MILRTYACDACGHFMEVELRADEWDTPPPVCPHCDGTQMGQEFKAPSIGGSNIARAVRLAEDIAEKDYGVADLQSRGEGEAAKVRYRDQGDNTSTWRPNDAALAQAVAIGRETRLQHGSALDIIKTMPDLIEVSKRRSGRIW